MKRFMPVLLAVALGAAAGYFFSRDCPTPVGVISSCEASVAVEKARGEKACDDRVDKMLAERPAPEPTPSPADPVG